MSSILPTKVMRTFYFKKSPPKPSRAPQVAGSGAGKQQQQQPQSDAGWPFPNFRLRVDDISHPGAQLFFANVNPDEVLRDAAWAVFSWLYTPVTVPRHVESVVLVLRSMDGVAHTMGSDIYKEIHFSLEWIAQHAHRAKDEIRGVLVHEMVHCYQHDGNGTCPTGFTEGVADWVRLHAGFAPPHWREDGGSKWDDGYASTAYFLDWLEQSHGRGVVRTLNLTLRDRQYEDNLFKEHTGKKVTKLYSLYRESLNQKKAPAVPN